MSVRLLTGIRAIHGELGEEFKLLRVSSDQVVHRRKGRQNARLRSDLSAIQQVPTIIHREFKALGHIDPITDRMWVGFARNGDFDAADRSIAPSVL